jgi:hypothetical protein
MRSHSHRTGHTPGRMLSRGRSRISLIKNKMHMAVELRQPVRMEEEKIDQLIHLQ